MSEVIGAWISDEDSFFAHLQTTFGGYRQTACGIILGQTGMGYYFSVREMRAHAVGKPECSVCKERVRT